jgi:hypothetical protein
MDTDALDKRLLTQEWRDTTLHAIVADIFDTTLGGTGLSLGATPVLYVAHFIAVSVTPRHVFDRLAVMAGTSWEVDNAGLVHFV